MKMSQRIYLFSLGFAILFSFNQLSAQQTAPPSEIARHFKFRVPNADIREIVDAIEKKFDIPVCFEMEDLDPKTKAIRISDKITELESKVTATTSLGEKNILSTLRNIKATHPDAIVGWKLPRYSIEVEGIYSLEEFLAKIFKQIPEYNYKIDNTYLVVFPKGKSILSFNIPRLKRRNTPTFEILRDLQTDFSSHSITLFHTGGKQGGVDLAKVNISDIDLPETQCLIFLSRLCQASDPPLKWRLLGMKGSRLLTFYSLSIK